MRITIDNFHENIEFITCFLQIFVILEKKNLIFFGGIVRDLIVPFSIYQKNNSKFGINSFKKLLRKIPFIDLNDIDIWIRIKDHHFHDRECIHGTCLLRNKVDSILKTLFDSGIWSFSYQPKEYNHVKYAESYLIESEICNFEIKLDFVSSPSLENIDFDVNNLSWSRKNGFSLVNKSLKNINMILERKEISSGYFNNIKRDEILCIDVIFDNIIQKKCLMLNMSDLKVNNNKTISNRYLKMISKEFKILNCSSFDIYQKFEINSIKNNHENTCSICMSEIYYTCENIKFDTIIKTSCNHLFHAKCIFTWWSSQNNPDKNLIGTCPLDRTQHILWNV
jgi:hypothetical protein